ncbi:Snf7 family like protein [Aduncisulcus paluster]|uniref:Snf7 family like protein n=1 Tax=Aduncisulcus paluster TaxID=2918883 RepID=A0ABQ5KQX0_9EUKA|nr:Snf7 family like protein [Aduncisulcus paluster]|eukprot:gnl/Carplike_NY0171/898_a1234_2322.p1 GENE.gnl/Carplike_NY0171/898_a1234_2322~~gnl/Carplike_NY0171/898_a1234_2322.p1  ORF type:complete len:238 (+),score=79.23 gnl/Carplike_NY0171/898_a1234_2322:48-716(+)
MGLRRAAKTEEAPAEVDRATISEKREGFDKRAAGLQDQIDKISSELHGLMKEYKTAPASRKMLLKRKMQSLIQRRKGFEKRQKMITAQSNTLFSIESALDQVETVSMISKELTEVSKVIKSINPEGISAQMDQMADMMADIRDVTDDMTMAFDFDDDMMGVDEELDAELAALEQECIDEAFGAASDPVAAVSAPTTEEPATSAPVAPVSTTGGDPSEIDFDC